MALPTQPVRTLTDPQLASPAGIAMDAAAGRLVVTRPLANAVAWADVTVASPAFATFGSFGTNPAAAGFSSPVAAVVVAGGHLIVLDSGNNEIDRYTAAGGGGGYAYDAGFLGGNRSTFAGVALAQPSDVKLVGASLYVLDAGRGRVVKLDLGTGAAVVVVTDLAWSQASGLAVDAAGAVYVSDTFNNRVLKYPAAGGAPATIAGNGTGAGQVRQPRGIALDAQGNVFVADSGNQRVQVFDANGASIARIAPAGAFGSIRGLVFDGAGDLYVSDFTRGAIVQLGAAAGGPVLRLETSVREFGSVGVGYALDRPVMVNNDGSAALNVSAVASGSALFAPKQTSFQVPAGGRHPLAVRFAPTAPGFATTTLSLTSDSLTGTTAGCVLRGTGTTPPLVDSVLVLDRSGSMYQSAGTQTKMAALHAAAALFADLARPDLGDRLGVVGFDHVAATAFPITPVTDTPPPSRVAAKAAIVSLTPRGATSIGAGMERARNDYAAAGAGTGSGTRRKALVVVTDGMENTAPFVKGGPANAVRVDLAQYAGVTIYTVGLGLGTTVDLGVLTSLATTFRGAFYLTEDRWLTLPKFFVEIFGDSLGEFVALDPDFEVRGAATTRVEFDLVPEDTGATVAIYWAQAGRRLDLRIVAPTGAVLTAASAAATPGIRHGSGPGYAFFRFPLPLPQSLGRAWDGTWRVEVDAGLQAGQTERFGLSVLVSSNLGLSCALERESDATGEPVSITATVSAYGNAILPDRTSVTMTGPAHSRGELLATVRAPDEKQRAAEGASPAAQALAWVEANDKRFRERVSTEVEVSVDRSSGGPVLRAALPDITLEGAYEVRLVTEVDRNGLVVRRECGHTFAAIGQPSAELTAAEVERVRANRFVVRLRPVDDRGNLLGPGLGPSLHVQCRGARCGKVTDKGDGSYEVVVTTAKPDEVELVLLLRGRELRWTWKELLEGRRRGRRGGRPRAWPRA